MTANNNYGSSLPSDRVRSLTLDSGIGSQTSVAVVPVLPGRVNQSNKIIHIFMCCTICKSVSIHNVNLFFKTKMFGAVAFETE